ncbi:MAG TPA: YheC/YheD family protein [Bacillota bacterium]|nr:YheC/YheD family protein [Bacillota bacterium]
MLRLGIMTHQIKDLQRFHPYVTVSREEGFDEILVFTPESVDLSRRYIRGFTYRNSCWQRVTRTFPSMSIDIGYYTQVGQIQTVKRIKGTPLLPFVGYGLGNKWTIQKHLMSSPELSPYLLPTAMVKDCRTIFNYMNQYHCIMVKPLNGKGGKGIIKLSKDKTQYIWEETEERTSISLTPSQTHDRLKKLLSTNKYIVQKWIDIRDRDGHIYDIRVLVQKNKFGQWQLTGMGIRQANEEKITSNLSGGGQAHPVFPFLKAQFNEEKARNLIQRLELLAGKIPVHLESSYHKRLVELGLDLAVDHSGDLWVIEVNIKPGRTLWKKIGLEQAADASLRAPIQYALYLLKQK